MDKLKKKEKSSYIFKITLSSALLSVLCLFFLIDTKNVLGIGLLKFYAVFIGIGLLFGGLIGFFVGLYLWGKIKSKQIEPTLKGKAENQAAKKKIWNVFWNVYIELLGFISILVLYSSIFLGKAFESNKLMFILSYLGAFGFFITLIVFKLYQWILKLKHKIVENTLIFQILYIIYGMCISISIILFMMQLE